MAFLPTEHPQAICSVLRTPIASIDSLSIKLPDPDASKVQWMLECYSGKVLFPHFLCVDYPIDILVLDREMPHIGGRSGD